MNSDESSLLHLMPLHKNIEIRGGGGPINLYRRRSLGERSLKILTINQSSRCKSSVYQLPTLLIYYGHLLLAFLPEERYINFLTLHRQAL